MLDEIQGHLYGYKQQLFDGNYVTSKQCGTLVDYSNALNYV